eukprot:PhM_4_TR2461/c4_g1_i1/m.15299
MANIIGGLRPTPCETIATTDEFEDRLLLPLAAMIRGNTSEGNTTLWNSNVAATMSTDEMTSALSCSSSTSLLVNRLPTASQTLYVHSKMTPNPTTSALI